MTTLFQRFFRKRKPKNPINQNVFKYKAVALTHVGNIRKVNEDRVGFLDFHDVKGNTRIGALGVVCDGMGGHNSGEIASQLAIDTIFKIFDVKAPDVISSLSKTLEKANNRVFSKANKSDSLKGMGTTASILACVGKEIYLAHVGDSRIYFKRGALMSQLTKDHSYVEYLIANGMITEEEKSNHPKRNVLVQALGTKEELKYDCFKFNKQIEIGDKFILCSDGLYEYVSNSEMAEVLDLFSLHESAEKFIELALQRGGHDNISVLIIECVSNTKSDNSITKEIKKS